MPAVPVEKAARVERAPEPYLACHTQEEIAGMLGVDRTTITKWISDVKNAHLSKNHIPDSFQLYNLWQFNACDDRYGMDGR